MKLVKLPSGNYVNPDFVTSINYLPGPTQYTPGTTVMWVVGGAGYHTYEMRFSGDCRDELYNILRVAKR